MDRFELDDIAEWGSSSTTHNARKRQQLQHGSGQTRVSHFSVQLYCSDAVFTANQTSLATTTYNDGPNRPGHTPEAYERVQAYVLVISLTADSDTSDRIAGYAAMGQLQADRQCIAELPRESRSLNLPK